MALNYLSRPFKSDPYVLPLDLNLFAKVGTVKQQQFDTGVKQTQDMIDKFGTLDVIKEEDRKYLNDKINGVVNSINGMGGVDFSDRNNVVQIESLGSNIYGDQSILNAVSSTASVRNLVKSYNDYKTNPKLSKLYSPVNEWYDMRRVNEWVADGQTGSSYGGPSTASPWVDYKTSLTKAAEKIKASDQLELIDNDLYWSKTKNTFVTPDQVIAQAQGLLTPEERIQMKKDATYLYTAASPVAPEGLIQKAAAQYDEKLNMTATMQAFYKQQADAAAHDPVSYQRYALKAEEFRQQVEQLKAGRATLADNLIKKYQQDPEELMYQIYSDDFNKGLAAAHSYSKRDVSIIPNQAKMFTLRMQQAAEFHKDDVDYRNRMLDLQAQANAIKMFGEQVKLYKKVDPKTGEVSYLPQGFGSGAGFTSNEPNLQDPDDLKVTETGLLTSNTNLEIEKDQVHLQMLQQYISQHPELGIKVSTASGEGNSGVQFQLLTPEAQQAVEEANGRRGFQVEDLAGVNQGNLRSTLKSAGYTDEQLNLLRGFYDNYTMLKDGNSNVSVPQEFTTAVKRIELLDERIRANNEKLRMAHKAVYDKLGLTEDERRTMDQALQEGITGTFWEYQKSFFWSKEKQRLLDKVSRIQHKYKADWGEKKISDMVQEHLDKVSTRDVYEGRIFDEKQPNPGVQRLIWDQIQKGIVKIDDADKISSSDIIPIKTFRREDGSWHIKAQIKSGSGEEATFQPVTIPLNDNNAAALGMQSDPYDHLNYAVNLTGQSGDLSVYGSKDLALSVVVFKKNITAMNDYSSFAKVKYYIKDANGNKVPDGKGGFKYTLIEVPGTNGLTPSEAYALVEQKIKDAAQQYRELKKQFPDLNPYEHFKAKLEEISANQY